MNKKQDNSELVKHIIGSARWATIIRLSAQIFSWLSTLVVIRFVTPEDYGLNAMLESPMVLMMLASTLGLHAALVQSKSISDEELPNLFGWLLIVNGALFTIYFFGSYLLADYYNQPRLVPLGQALACIFLLVPFRVIPTALLDRKLDFKLRAKLELVATVISACTTLVLAYFGAGVWALVIGVITNRAILSILLMVAQPWFVFPRFRIAPLLDKLAVGGRVTLSGVFSLSSGLLVPIIAGPVIGASSLGIYAVAMQISMLPLSKGMPILNQTMLPAFSKFQDQQQAASYYFQRLIGVISLYFAPIMVGVACIADVLVPLVFGQKWIDATLPLTVLSLAMILRMNTMLIKTALTSMGRSDLSLRASFMQFSLLLPLTFVAVQFGMIGLVYSWAIVEVVVALAAITWSRAVFRFTLKDIVLGYYPALTCSFIMAIAVLGARIGIPHFAPIIDLILYVLIGAVSYYISARSLFPKRLRTALNIVFGNRLRFLTPRGDDL